MNALAEVYPGVPASECRSCGQRIFWAVTDGGVRMPVNVAANPAGNLVAMLRGGKPVVVPFDEAKHAAAIRRTSHFVTCQQAADWRKPRPT